jgi:hypothetical protein
VIVLLFYVLIIAIRGKSKVYQLLAHGRWFSPGTPAYSTTKTGRHDIAEILLKNQNQNQIITNIGLIYL